MLFVFQDSRYALGNLVPNIFGDPERIQCLIKRKIQRAHQAYDAFHRSLNTSLLYAFFDSLCFNKVTVIAHAINSLSDVIRNFNSAIADGFEFFCDRYIYYIT